MPASEPLLTPYVDIADPAPNAMVGATFSADGAWSITPEPQPVQSTTVKYQVRAPGEGTRPDDWRECHTNSDLTWDVEARADSGARVLYVALFVDEVCESTNSRPITVTVPFVGI